MNEKTMPASIPTVAMKTAFISFNITEFEERFLQKMGEQEIKDMQQTTWQCIKSL
jgi:hypothetical protein